MGDDYDDTEIANFSAEVSQKADEFKTLGQINAEKEAEAKKQAEIQKKIDAENAKKAEI